MLIYMTTDVNMYLLNGIRTLGMIAECSNRSVRIAAAELTADHTDR